MAYNDIYFPVELQPVRFEGFTDGEMESQTLFADDFVSVVRLDTNKVLAVHKSGYKLIKNEDLFPIFEEAIEKSNIDHRGMMVKDEVANSGAKVLRTYRFPKHRITLGSRPDGKADEIDLTITLRNSYDGVWSFGYSMGAFRQICTNGMIIGNKFLDVKSKHTKHMDISPYVASLETAAVLYLEEVDNWRKWREITVSSAKAKDFLETQKHLTQKIRDDIYGLFIDDSRREGASAWAFFNAMTNWSTHAKVRKDAVDNAPAVRVGREDIVRKMLTSKEWKELVNELL